MGGWGGGRMKQSHSWVSDGPGKSKCRRESKRCRSHTTEGEGEAVLLSTERRGAARRGAVRRLVWRCRRLVQHTDAS